MKKKRKIKKHQILIILWLLTSIWGAINIFSASYITQIKYGANPYKPLIEQIIFIVFCLGFLIYILGQRKPPYHVGKKGAVPFFKITIGLLAFVLIGGLFIKTPGLFIRGGAKSTIPLPFISIQPLEVYKITLILYLAKMFSTPGIYDTVDGLKKAAFMSAVGLVLIFAEPDLGGAILVGGLTVCMFFYNGQNIKLLFKVLVPIIIIGIIGYYTVVDDYQTARIAAWLHPFENGNDSTISNNIVNGYVAISNGGVFGSGYLNSVQKTGYLFASYTDFIYAVICEEWGVVGSIITIGLLLLVSFQCFNIGYTAHERFGMLYCFGYGTLILVQSFVNIGGVVGLIPMTGVTLPFISMGMNSFMILSVGLFYVVVIDKERIRQKRIRDEKTSNLFMS